MSSDALLPTVSGQFGTRATLAVPKAKPSGKFVIAPQIQGRGRAARAGDVAIVNYTAQVWRSGKPLPGSYDKGARPQVFAVGRGGTLPALDKAVSDEHAGSRVLVAAPPAAAYGTTGSAQLGVSGTDTVVFVVDIMNVIGAHATVQGKQRSVPDDLPEVLLTAPAVCMLSGLLMHAVNELPGNYEASVDGGAAALSAPCEPEGPPRGSYAGAGSS
ncbi:FKBP-type peptidyl-prolyl cis-trans isomerase [Streptomyces sp. NPDC002870]|uniref:FKBP-type peptidyl-prolyl cis-trans isomerase n=1 Tax=Streptomyces sp. NPDC002870 TaxID=3364666 RepID=UPI00368A53BD